MPIVNLFVQNFSAGLLILENYLLIVLRNALFFLIFILATSCTSNSRQEIPWQDQIFYFLLTDRFADGDSTNNDQGSGEYDPARAVTFHGGDFAGIRQQIPYLQELGVTAVWLTPPVRNQWWNPDTSFTGYHGYWASHFMETDPHYGTMSEYQQLADDLHRNDMYLIQDVVVNHTADFFSYQQQYDPNRPQDIARYAGAPLQPPFDRNDPRNSDHRHDSIYHWTPSVTDFQDQQQKYTYQMADLDDLNTGNPAVREALLRSFQFWIREVGVDGLRFDTPLYVEHPFWRAFLYEGQNDLPGIEPYAAQLGKPDFYTFGETWVNAPPFSDTDEQEAARYLGTRQAPEMDGILNFPLHQTITRVFAGARPTQELTYRLQAQQSYFPSPTQRLNFIDNHDMPRFRTQASEEATRQALFFIMSIPGVPVLYQGTEQGQVETRPNMFTAFDIESEDFQFIRELIRFRKNQTPTRRGTLTVLADGSQLPGLFLYRLNAPDDTLYIALNTRDYPLLVSDLPLTTTTRANTAEAVYQLNGSQELTVRGGQIDWMRLSAKGGFAFRLQPKQQAAEPAAPEVPAVAMPDSITARQLALPLSATGADSSVLIIDGRGDQTVPISCADNECTARVLLANLSNGQHLIQRLDWYGGRPYLSQGTAFDVHLPRRLLTQVRDPQGDDLGLTGSYRYPTHPSFARPNDLSGLTIHTRGHNLEVTAEMTEPLSTVWNPPNGFDHLHLSLFIDLPGQKGATTLPQRNAIMPDGATWDVHIQANGWTTQVHTAREASATHPGTALTTKPEITTQPGKGTITFRIPAATLGHPTTLDGIQFYLTTWDSAGEGGLRPLAPKAASFTYGGAQEDSPRIMDELWIPWAN